MLKHADIPEIFGTASNRRRNCQQRRASLMALHSFCGLGRDDCVGGSVQTFSCKVNTSAAHAYGAHTNTSISHAYAAHTRPM